MATETELGFLARSGVTFQDTPSNRKTAGRLVHVLRARGYGAVYREVKPGTQRLYSTSTCKLLGIMVGQHGLSGVVIAAKGWRRVKKSKEDA